MKLAATTNIVEVDPHGHRLWYVRLLVEHIVGRVRLVSTPEVFADPAFDVHLRELAKLDRLVVHPSQLPQVVGDLLKAGDAVVIPEADKHLGWLTKLRRPARLTRLTLLVMRQVGEVRNPYRRAGKRALMTMLRLRGAYVGELANPVSGVRSRFSVPDPQPPTVYGGTRDQARAYFGWPRERPLCVVVGSIDARKQLSRVFDAFRDEALVDLDVGLLVLGKCAPAEAALVTQATRDGTLRNRLLVHDRYATDHDVDAAIVAADAVLNLHADGHPSGILLRSLRAGRRVVVSRPISGNYEIPNGAVIVAAPHESLGAVVASVICAPVDFRPLHLPGPVEFVEALCRRT